MADVTDLLSQFPHAGSSTGGDAFNIALFTLISMLMLVGISFVVAKAMTNRKLEDWAKDEFLQVLINAAIVGSLFLLMAPGTGAIITIFNSLVPSEAVYIPTLNVLSGGAVTSTCPPGGVTSGTVLCFASNYLVNLSGQITSIITVLFSIIPMLDMLSKFSIDMVIVSISPMSGYSVFVQVLNTIMQSMIFLTIIVNVENFLLMFIDKVALTLFLPIGIVLRCFFATRRIGGTLIALAVGAYIVFPLMLSLNAIAVNQAMMANFAPLNSAANNLSTLNPFQTYNTSSDFANPSKSVEYLGKITTVSGDVMATVTQLPSLLVTYVGLIIVQIIILPILALIITGIAIKELAVVFGSEVDLGRLGA